MRIRSGTWAERERAPRGRGRGREGGLAARRGAPSYRTVTPGRGATSLRCPQRHLCVTDLLAPCPAIAMRTMLRAPCTCTAFSSFTRCYTTDRSVSLSSTCRFSPCPVPSSAAVPALAARRLGVFRPAGALGPPHFRCAPASRCFAVMAFEKIKVHNPIVEMDGATRLFCSFCCAGMISAFENALLWRCEVCS